MSVYPNPQYSQRKTILPLWKSLVTILDPSSQRKLNEFAVGEEASQSAGVANCAKLRI